MDFCSISILSKVIRSLTFIPFWFKIDTLGMFADANLKFLSIPFSEWINKADLYSNCFKFVCNSFVLKLLISKVSIIKTLSSVNLVDRADFIANFFFFFI